MSNWIPTVKTVTDNVDPVSGSTVNGIISSLAQRDQYLFDRIDSYENKAILLAYDIPVDNSVIVNDVVYFKPNDNTGSETLLKALATYQNSVDPSHLIPANSAFVFGIVKQIYTTTDNEKRADVYLRGLVGGLTLNNLLDSTSIASGKTQGPLYLSSLEAGKLTFYAGGSSIFVGFFVGDGQLFLSPNIDSLNQLYFNYKVYLAARVAGTYVQNVDTTYSITASNFARIGWVDADAAATNYGYSKPTGAKFFYNLPSATQVLGDSTLTQAQQKDALLLKDALPPYPAAYTQLFLNGVLQLFYDVTDHPTGIYLIDNAGIWWFDNSATYKPWVTDSNPVNLILQTTKLNPTYKAAVVASLKPYLDGSNDTSKVLQFLDSDTGNPSNSGDLLAKFNLGKTSIDETPVSGTFVKDVSYDALNGNLVLKTSPGVVDINPGPGIQLAKSKGIITVSLTNFSLGGTVEDIEPEESDFVYKGLHSYLRMKNPSGTQKVGFVGKFVLPDVLPSNTSLRIKLLAFGEANTPNNAAKFRFEYVISKPGIAVNDTTYKGNNGSDIPVLGLTTTTQVISLNSSSLPYFEIPYTFLEPRAYVNFRISRINSDYNSNIDVIGVYWAIENIENPGLTITPQNQTQSSSTIIGITNPEGTEAATVGTLFFNTSNTSLWIKQTGTDASGWIQLI